jgi:CRISPR system Cascade subunit CasE
MPDGKRDFLFRHEQQDGEHLLYVVSPRLPAVEDRLWNVEPRLYIPKIETGERLHFRVRINPVVERPGEIRLGGDGSPRLRKNGSRAGQPKRKVVRHDVVMDLKLRLGHEAWSEKLTQVRLIEATRGWFGNGSGRAARCGFQVDTLVAEGYRQHRLPRRNAKPICFSTLDVEGTLIVLDAETFVHEALYKGIGPAKAFGCGLLLVRRVQGMA